MQAIEDIFTLWPTLVEFAEAVDVTPDRVRKWKKFRRIPEESREAVAAAVRQKGQPLTAEQIGILNAPMKPRGRPLAKKVTRRRLQEARAS